VVEEESEKVVATIPFDIEIISSDERARETVMGNIVTDAIRRASGADIAFINGGSIRDQFLPAGEITKAQLVKALPYSNTVHMAEVEGSVLLEALEHGVSMFPKLSDAFIHVSGLSFSFNPLESAGSRVSNVRIGSAELDPDKMYTLATTDFLAGGGSQYEMLVTPFLKQLPLTESGLSAFEDILIWYLDRYREDLLNEIEGRVIAGWIFPDLSEEENEVVNALAVRGVIEGYPDGTFRAGISLTRAQMAVMLVRFLKLPDSDEQIDFIDMTGDEWYANYVQSCVAAGLFGGFDDGSFRGGNPLMIGQLSFLIERIDNPDAEYVSIPIEAARIDAAYAFYNLLYPPDVDAGEDEA
jgi:hypothetical protein